MARKYILTRKTIDDTEPVPVQVEFAKCDAEGNEIFNTYQRRDLMETSITTGADDKYYPSSKAVKDYVDTAVTEMSADFKGSFANWAAVPGTWTEEAPNKNDYIIVENASDYDEQHNGTWQFKYTKTGDYSKENWLPEREIKNASVVCRDGSIDVDAHDPTETVIKVVVPFSEEEKTKLGGIEEGANVNVITSITVNEKDATVNNKNASVTLNADDLSDENCNHKFTTAEDIAKLSTVKENAEPNVLEAVKVNGTSIRIDKDDKSVDITDSALGIIWTAVE